MCGIVGVIQPDPLPETQFTSMRDALSHRGPDDAGYNLISSQQTVAQLGHRRLSIIDLSKNGHQPMADPSGRYWLVYNGEVYNHLQLRRDLPEVDFKSTCDTETLLHLLIKFGLDAVARLNGMFAFAFWDSQEESLTVARDRFGQKPFYYWHHNKGIAFSSELRSLLKHPGLDVKVDPRSLSRYLAYEYVPAPHCMIAGVKKLLPGHVATWIKGHWASQPYWHIDFQSKSQLIESMDVHERDAMLDTLFTAAVERRLMSDVPLGVFLSGGLDSSLLLETMIKLRDASTVKTFAIGFDEPSFDESSYAREVAQFFGTDHHERILRADDLLALFPTIVQRLDEPMADASLVPTFLLSQFAKEQVTVALGGDGGDELFAGYDPVLAMYWASKYQAVVPKFAHQKLVSPLVNALPVDGRNMSLEFRLKHFIKGVYNQYAQNHVARRNQVWLGAFQPHETKGILHRELAGSLNSLDPYADINEAEKSVCCESDLQTLLHSYQRFYLADDILTKVDRASMMVSLEARTPFLDVEYAEFANSLPDKDKFFKRQRKVALKRLYGKRLPASVTQRSKKGFGIPLSAWMRGPLAPEMDAAFSPERLDEDGFFNPETVQALWESHRLGKRDNRKQLWTLYVFSKWWNSL